MNDKFLNVTLKLNRKTNIPQKERKHIYFKLSFLLLLMLHATRGEIYYYYYYYY